MRLTIAIPVFNAEKTLERCLDSVFDQRQVDDFEVICIDDGSTDSSLDILKGYEKAHENLRVVKSVKKGAFFARRQAVELARGKWIGFVDSDDEISPYMYSRMLSRTTGAAGMQVVVCAFEKLDGQGRLQAVQMNCYGDSEYDFSVYPAERGVLLNVNPAYWNKIFLTELARRAIVLEKPPKIMEDLIFWASILPFIDKIAFVSEALYRYRDSGGSVTKQIGRSEMEEASHAVGELSVFLASTGNVQGCRDIADLLSALMYVHYGIGFTVNYNTFRSGESFRSLWKESVVFLQQLFGDIAKNQYLRMHYIAKHQQLLKFYVAARLYRLKIWPFAVRIYHTVTKIAKKDLKW